MELLEVIGLAALPAAGNLAGALLAERRHPSRGTLNLALHAASGILFAVIAVEVMPRALGAAPAWLLALGFLAGGGAYLLVQARIERWRAGAEERTGVGVWMVYVGVVADLVGDGLLIGAGSAVSAGLGLVLALGQVLADVPEGFAVAAGFRRAGLARGRRLLLSASLLLPVAGSAVLASLLLRSQGEAPKMVALVAVAGLYTLAAVEDMLREAHESAEDTRWSACAFLAGFALFLVVSGTLR